MPNQTARGSSSSQSRGYLQSINRDLKALNASILVITQKIKYLVRNEKILGRNLIVINKKVRDLQSRISVTENRGISEETRTAVADLIKQVSSLNHQLVETQARLSDVQQSSAKAEEVKEIKYVVDNLNPLHFVTREQVEKLVDEKLKKK
jgi:vacuolar-type H+-ATPase subunit I/STV1